METIEYKNINFTAWDVGGRDKIVSPQRHHLSIFPSIYCFFSFSLFQRPLYRHYYQNTDVIILVVDSNDRERISESKDEFWRLLGEDELKSALFLIMANKQDLPNAMSVEEVTDKLDLHKIRDREWRK